MPLSGRCLGSLCLLVFMTFLGACTSLERMSQANLDALVPLDQLPAEYGQLVAVTQFGDPAIRPGWYELWFSDPESGKITQVPFWRETWSYAADRIRVVERG